MKKFYFSLEKVLDFKLQTLDVLKNELASLQFQLHTMDLQIEKMNQEFSDLNLQLQTEMQEGLSLNDIAVYKIYLDTLNNKILKIKNLRKQLYERILKKEQEVLSAKSSISGLEKLKDKQWGEYIHAEQKEQETAIEEFVSHVRNW